MSTLGLYTAEQVAAASRLHVTRSLLVEMQVDAGTYRLHPGAGRIRAGGHVWLGVQKPGGARVVSVSRVPLTTGPNSPIVYLTMTGAEPELVQAVLLETHLIVGRQISLYTQIYDDRVRPVGALVPALVGGRMTGPTWKVARGQRAIRIGIETELASRKFAPGWAYDPGSMRRLSPDDSFFDQVGSSVSETWP